MRQWNISPDRHLPIEFLKNKLEQIESMYDIDQTLTFKGVLTPRPWLDTISVEDANIVWWALNSLIGHIESIDIDSALRDIMSDSELWPWLQVLSVCVSPNKQVFRIDSPGFLTNILARLYKERSHFKKLAVSAASEYERVMEEIKLREVEEKSKMGYTGILAKMKCVEINFLT
jgi:hypothetical protein